MSRPLLIFVISVLLLLCGACKKTGTANTANWVGVYNTTNTQDSLNNIVITASGDNLLRVEIKGVSGGYIYSYTTLQHVTVSNPTVAVISEKANITGSNGLYDIQGTMTISGNNITLAATATQIADVKNINFTGLKQ